MEPPSPYGVQHRGRGQIPNVSRDGSEIVFARVAAVNTSEPESRPSLSADGKRLYFGRGATADIYVSARTELGD